MNVLGLSALYHDSAVALVKDGDIVAAVQEERFSRVKHDAAPPFRSIQYCLKAGRISMNEIDAIVYYDNPYITMDRFLRNILSLGESSDDVINTGTNKFFSKKIWIKRILELQYPEIYQSGIPFYVMKHHVSHAASAFYPSPYDEALILTLDGVGEWTTLSIGVGKGNAIKLMEEIRYPHSLGLLYSAFTYFCGFKVNSGDYKFMGLAPYGKPVYYDLIKEQIIDIKPDGSFRLNLDYFDYQNGRTMVNEAKMEELFGGKRRQRESKITKREMDIAASVQKVTEEIVLKIAAHAKDRYGKNIENLCMAGGVALNCVANGKLFGCGLFKNVWIQPAAGDAGGALGAALYGYYKLTGSARITDGRSDMQKGSFLGPEFSDSEIEDYLKCNNYVYHRMKYPAKEVAELLNNQKIVGYFNGRMEFGPRALGHRSILADPRSSNMQSRLNLKIKYRESFRPFAPSVLLEDVGKYFELKKESPYMLVCANVKKELLCDGFNLDQILHENEMNMLPVVNAKRSEIPAVTHVDYSARIQTVDKKTNKDYYELICEFKNLTGCAVLVNTSFNVRGEPIVCSLEDAYRCFMRTDMDVLVLGNFCLYKDEQNGLETDLDWRKEYVLD